MGRLTLILVILIAALQYPLWVGKGSWLRVWEVDQKLKAQKDANAGLKNRNASLEAEVHDLKQGYEAIEERGRSELGMVKQDEIFFQILEESRKAELPKPVSGVSENQKPESNATRIKPSPAPAAKKLTSQGKHPAP